LDFLLILLPCASIYPASPCCDLPEHEWDSETEPPKNERLELQSPEGRTLEKASNAAKSGRLSATREVEEMIQVIAPRIGTTTGGTRTRLR
jgi:hypothetical protein